MRDRQPRNGGLAGMSELVPEKLIAYHVSRGHQKLAAGANGAAKPTFSQRSFSIRGVSQRRDSASRQCASR